MFGGAEFNFRPPDLQFDLRIPVTHAVRTVTDPADKLTSIFPSAAQWADGAGSHMRIVHHGNWPGGSKSGHSLRRRSERIFGPHLFDSCQRRACERRAPIFNADHAQPEIQQHRIINPLRASPNNDASLCRLPAHACVVHARRSDYVRPAASLPSKLLTCPFLVVVHAWGAPI